MVRLHKIKLAFRHFWDFMTFGEYRRDIKTSLTFLTIFSAINIGVGGYNIYAFYNIRKELDNLQHNIRDIKEELLSLKNSMELGLSGIKSN